MPLWQWPQDLGIVHWGMARYQGVTCTHCAVQCIYSVVHALTAGGTKCGRMGRPGGPRFQEISAKADSVSWSALICTQCNRIIHIM